MPADIGGHVHKDQARPRPDQAIGHAGQANPLQDQKLRNDVQEARHHQRKEIEPENLLAPREADARKSIGRQRGDKHRNCHRQAGVDHTVADGNGKNVHLKNMLIGRKIQPCGDQLRRIRKHIAEFLK